MNMFSKQYIVCLSMGFLYACNNTNTPVLEVKQQDTTQHLVKVTTASKLEFLEAFKDRYPNDVNLLHIPEIENRMRKLMGKEYDYVISIWEVETPMEIINGEFYAWGMQAHSGGDQSAVLMADIKKDKLFMGVRNDAKVNVYAEDSTDIPKRLLDWEKEGKGENIK